jgi:hypothetical protein
MATPNTKLAFFESKMSAMMDDLQEEQKSFMRSLLETAWIKAHHEDAGIDKTRFMSDAYDRLKQQMFTTMDMKQSEQKVLHQQQERFHLQNNPVLPMQLWINDQVNKAFNAIRSDRNGNYEVFARVFLDGAALKMKMIANNFSKMKDVNVFSPELMDFSQQYEKFQIRLASFSAVLENMELNAGVPNFSARLKAHNQSLTQEYTDRMNTVMSTTMGNGLTVREAVAAMDSYRNKSEAVLPHEFGVH